MAASAAVLARVLSEPLSQMDGFASHPARAPAWIVSLCCALGALKVFIDRIQVLSHQQFLVFHEFVSDLHDRMVHYMGCAGDWHHNLWLQSVSNSLDIQVAAQTQDETVKDEAARAFFGLRNWIQNQPDGTLDNMARFVSGIQATLDSGSDVPDAGILLAILKEVDQTSRFMEMLRTERREALMAQVAQREETNNVAQHP